MSPNYVLTLAANTGLDQDLKHALSLGAKANLVSDEGYPVIALAALSGKVSCIQILLDAGADIDAMDEKGRTAAELCAQEGRFESVKFLLDRGADGSVFSANGFNLLHYAAAAGETLLLERAVRAGANLNALTREPAGLTPLRMAALKEKPECVRKLLELGAPVKQLVGGVLSPEVGAVVTAWVAREMIAESGSA